MNDSDLQFFPAEKEASLALSNDADDDINNSMLPPDIEELLDLPPAESEGFVSSASGMDIDVDADEGEGGYASGGTSIRDTHDDSGDAYLPESDPEEIDEIGSSDGGSDSTVNKQALFAEFLEARKLQRKKDAQVKKRKETASRKKVRQLLFTITMPLTFDSPGPKICCTQFSHNSTQGPATRDPHRRCQGSQIE